MIKIGNSAMWHRHVAQAAKKTDSVAQACGAHSKQRKLCGEGIWRRHVAQANGSNSERKQIQWRRHEELIVNKGNSVARAYGAGMWRR